jgi:hypothetical protein
MMLLRTRPQKCPQQHVILVCSQLAVLPLPLLLLPPLVLRSLTTHTLLLQAHQCSHSRS